MYHCCCTTVAKRVFVTYLLLNPNNIETTFQGNQTNISREQRWTYQHYIERRLDLFTRSLQQQAMLSVH